MPSISVNARRLLCPMPVIRLQDAVKKAVAGDEVEIICTDPGAMSDIPAWCRINGHKLLSSNNTDGEFIFLVEVGEDS